MTSEQNKADLLLFAYTLRDIKEPDDGHCDRCEGWDRNIKTEMIDLDGEGTLLCDDCVEEQRAYSDKSKAADSKAREEEKKRLADIADEYMEQLVRHLFSTHKCDHSAVSLVKKRFHAALTASKQDSEGTGKSDEGDSGDNRRQLPERDAIGVSGRDKTSAKGMVSASPSPSPEQANESPTGQSK